MPTATFAEVRLDAEYSDNTASPTQTEYEA